MRTLMKREMGLAAGVLLFTAMPQDLVIIM